MRYFIIVGLLLCAAPAWAQNVKNPTRAIFKCSADHDMHTGHEIDVINESGAVLQTLTFGTAAPDANGDVTLAINVQPVSFGAYTAKVRATAGAWKSESSEPSNVWERVPGKPGKPVTQ